MLIDSLKSLVKEIASNSTIDATQEAIDVKKTVIFFIGIKLISIKYSIDNVHVIKKLKISTQLQQKYYCNEILKEKHKEYIKELLIQNEHEKFSLGKLYEMFISDKERKYLGQVYTPKYIIEEMLKMSIDVNQVIHDPYYRVIDPSCGSGFFCLRTIEHLKKIIIDNKKEVLSKNPAKKEIIFKDVNKFIVENCIWGVDVDEFSVFISRVDILIKYCNDINTKLNIHSEDILIKKKNSQIPDEFYDLVIGNPPYIGHKKLPIQYKKDLKANYEDVYLDKSDISYCFFEKGNKLLKDGKVLTFITSRYFIEAPSAIKLRGYINKKFQVENIVDFYGYRVFKKVGISPAIIKCKKSTKISDSLRVFRFAHNNLENKGKIKQLKKNNFNNFEIPSARLNEKNWILLSSREKNIYDKINFQGELKLDEICDSYQGVITGCDKAFIVNKDIIESEKLEKEIIKPWIKNSEIEKYGSINSTKYIIYTDGIDDIANYPNICNHISIYRDKLMQRRECKKNVRKWYELQWGRNLDVLSKEKIVFPYKSDSNKFTIDSKGTLNSADVYSLTNFDESKCSIYFILGILNSKVYEFYFKCIAKKLTLRQYDYYPNKLMDLKVKMVKQTVISQMVKEIFKLKKLEDNNRKIVELQREIDEELFKVYELTRDEIKVIYENV